MVLYECPFCHRLFEAEALSKVEIDSNTLPNPPHLSRLGHASNTGTIARNPQAFTTWKTTYGCKHCGKEWTKLSVEEKPIPRQYLVDDQEKTDYDAEREAEEAREEEYVRESR
jgi:DNA-directed RNA polymerase subunit RPC12/RpoP